MLNLLAQLPGLRVFDKTSGVALLADRSGSANMWDTLKQQADKPYLVHRLDKGTSGVLLVATSQAAQRTLTEAFRAREVDKFYLAWVTGAFPAGRTFTLNLPMCKGRKSRYRLAGRRDSISVEGSVYHLEQDREGVDALSRVRCLAQRGDRSLLLVKPQTGRTHQIRVHLSWLGYPILGDHLYGVPNDPAQAAARLLLHCHCLRVPGWGVFRAPVPPEFEISGSEGLS